MAGSSRRWRIALLLVVLPFLVALILFLRFGTGQRLEFATKPFSREQEGLRDLWFGSRGRLMTASRVGSNLQVQEWNVQGALRETARHRHPLPVGLPPLPDGRLPSLRYSFGQAKPKDVLPVPQATLPYAVSGDGTKLAWAWGGRLHVTGGPKAGFEIRRESPATALTFTAGDAVTVLYENGRLESFDYRTGRKGIAGAVFGPASTIWSRGPILAVASFAQAQFVLLRVALDRLDQRWASLDIPSRAASMAVFPHSASRVAVGTERGFILTFDATEDGFRQGAYAALDTPRPVRALRFFARDQVLVGGDFPDIYLVEGDNARKLARTRNGVSLMDSYPPFVAYAGSGEFSVSTLGLRRHVTPVGQWILTFFALYLSVVALLYTIWHEPSGNGSG